MEVLEDGLAQELVGEDCIEDTYQSPSTSVLVLPMVGNTYNRLFVLYYVPHIETRLGAQ